MEVDLTEETNSDDKIDYSVAFTEDIADIDDIEDFYGDNYDDITLADKNHSFENKDICKINHGFVFFPLICICSLEVFTKFVSIWFWIFLF